MERKGQVYEVKFAGLRDELDTGMKNRESFRSLLGTMGV